MQKGSTMLKKIMALTVLSLALGACSTVPNTTQPSNLLFQTPSAGAKVLNVQRDDKLCGKDSLQRQNCPIELQIDGFKAGTFYVNTQAQYHLRPNTTYTLKAKNCTVNCATAETQINTCANGELPQITLSRDEQDRPVIYQTGGKACQVAVQTEEISLAVDTLFKFDRYQLNDLLLPGRNQLDEVARKINSGYARIDHIQLIGHTDRLGKTDYNQTLGANRAKTIQSYLIQKGMSPSILSTASMGESQPVTNGCHGVQPREALHACLQPDRRVVVKITGLRRP